jgi:hypothetical protein
MKPELKAHDSDFDVKIQNTFMDLGQKIDSTVT